LPRRSSPSIDSSGAIKERLKALVEVLADFGDPPPMCLSLSVYADVDVGCQAVRHMTVVPP
jgi:hypothetical protein